MSSPPVKAFILGLEGSDELREIGRELEDVKIALYLCRVKAEIKEIITRDGVLEIIPDNHFYASVDAAVEQASR